MLLLEDVRVPVVKVSQSTQKAKEGSAAADCGQVVHVVAEDVAADAGEDVDGEHSLATEEGLGGGPKVVEGVAIDEEVEEVPVEKGRGGEAPELAARDGLVVLAAPRRDPALARLLQEEGEAVELDEDVGDLPVL